MKNKYKALSIILSSVVATTSLTGCDIGPQHELAPIENYDTLNDDEAKIGETLKQELEVPNENFKLICEYTCDPGEEKVWRITGDKFLRLKVYTENLPENYNVYIDNVHIDTSIKSRYATVDGIKQDTMDDRIHNSLMLGFPISDNTSYIGVNAIEGCNESFISGTYFGMQGYSSGSITEKRYTESDYRELGVYANKISVVYDLLIKGPDDTDYKNISVDTDFIVYTSDFEIEYGKSKNIDETKKLVKEKNQ